jgi:Tfp pilus assembly protein PilF
VLRIYRKKFSAYLRIILILCASACQTLKNSEQENKKEEDILATQKSLVINYINQGQPNMALRELRPLEKSNPKDADLKNLMGLIYLSMQNAKGALVYLEEAYRLQPRAPIALNLSSALIESGQSVRATKILKDLKKSPAGKNYQYPERITHNIGLASERMNNLPMAEKYYKLALQENPYFYISLMRLGAVYEQQKKGGFAYQQYLKAREACLKCFDPIQSAVQLQLKAGKAALAAKTIQEYLANKELEAIDRAKAQRLLASASKNTQQAKSAPPAPAKAQSPR